ncbi:MULTISPECIES: hypothetical protein [unclassified Microcoleus]|uniref:hypothetical protein n=1 Tax=unclassified Microcoleus TaxID=2642155 RepID=UPI002FCE7FF2
MSNNVRHTIAKWIFKESRGFDELPPEDSTIIYAKALLICASGDGEVAPAEKDWIMGLTAARGVSDSKLEELKNYPATDSLEQVITSNDIISEYAKHAIIYDAIVACSADGEYQEGEKAAVRKAATLIGVSEDVVQQLEELYAEEKKLFDRKIQLFYPKGHPYG